MCPQSVTTAVGSQTTWSIRCCRSTICSVTRPRPSSLGMSARLGCCLPLLDSGGRSHSDASGRDAPRRLTLFSMRTIALMLTHIGRHLERVACIPGGHLMFTPGQQCWTQNHLSMPALQGLQRALEALAVRLAVAPYSYLMG